jgi:hypothetical protein
MAVRRPKLEFLIKKTYVDFSNGRKFKFSISSRAKFLKLKFQIIVWGPQIFVLIFF